MRRPLMDAHHYPEYYLALAVGNATREVDCFEAVIRRYSRVPVRHHRNI